MPRPASCFARWAPAGPSFPKFSAGWHRRRWTCINTIRPARRWSSSDARFALPPAGSADVPASWPLPPEGDALFQELQERQQQSHALMGNFLAQVAAAERHENWRSLYRLPPARIAALQQTPLTPAHMDWLQALPKADLHRHLGGCLDLAAQKPSPRPSGTMPAKRNAPTACAMLPRCCNRMTGPGRGPNACAKARMARAAQPRPKNAPATAPPCCCMPAMPSCETAFIPARTEA